MCVCVCVCVPQTCHCGSGVCVWMPVPDLQLAPRLVVLSPDMTCTHRRAHLTSLRGGDRLGGGEGGRTERGL